MNNHQFIKWLYENPKYSYKELESEINKLNPDEIKIEVKTEPSELLTELIKIINTQYSDKIKEIINNEKFQECYNGEKVDLIRVDTLLENIKLNLILELSSESLSNKEIKR